MQESRPFNNLLCALREPDYALIAPGLFAAQHSVGDVLYNPGEDVEIVHFPCGPAMASFVVSDEDGREVETALIGREGAVGGVISNGSLPAYTRIAVKFGGHFACINVSDLHAAKRKSPTLQNWFDRYADCLLSQIFQGTACNAMHSVEQRVAKWMLAAAERLGHDVVPFTHEELAALLGAGRSHTTRALRAFGAQGLIVTRRGSVLLRDSAALKKIACSCNDLVKHHFEEVLSGVYPNRSG